MSSPLIDSSILIDALRAKPAAITFLNDAEKMSRLTTHVIVVAEIFTGARDKNEQRKIESFVQRFDIVSPTETDASLALEFYKRHRLSDGVDWPDCQIAATAIRLAAEVKTLNVKHFAPFPGLQVSRPY